MIPEEIQKTRICFFAFKNRSTSTWESLWHKSLLDSYIVSIPGKADRQNTGRRERKMNVDTFERLLITGGPGWENDQRTQNPGGKAGDDPDGRWGKYPFFRRNLWSSGSL